MILRFTDEVSDQHELTVVEAEIERDLDNMQAVRVFVKRDTIDETNLLKGETEMFLVDRSSDPNDDARFGGIYRDIDRQGGTTEVRIDSFERLALYADPTPGGERWSGTADNLIIEDAVSNIPEISEGQIRTIGSEISMLFSHATQAKKIRETADVTNADVRYNPDKTLDYVGALGSDKTSGKPLSPDNQNVTGNFQAEKKGGDEDFTHLRVLGSGEGNHQRIFNIVPDDDPDSYPDEVRYTNQDWSSGNRKRWEVVSNKDIADPDALETFGLNYIRDITSGEYIDVTTTIRGRDVSLGDSFSVLYSQEEVDHEMRIVEMTERISSTGTDFEVTLSTRQFSRQDQAAKDRSDVQRYNKALQGEAVPINVAGGRQPVGPDPVQPQVVAEDLEAQSSHTHPYQMGVYYPDEVQYEHRLNVRVVGLPYRAYSRGTTEGGTVNTTSQSNSDLTNVVFDRNDFSQVEIDDFGWTTVSTVSPSSETSVLWSFSELVDPQTGTDINVIDIRLENVDDGSFVPNSGGVRYTIDNDTNRTVVLPESTDTGGDTIELQVRDVSGSGRISGQMNWIGLGKHNHAVEQPPHQHSPFPGIIEDFGFLELPQGSIFYPGDCDVRVNGNSQGTSFGDGTQPFEETVDITGSLNPGEFNEITVSSGYLGHMQVYLEGDVYRQILGDG